jgi:hypothetical protein
MFGEVRDIRNRVCLNWPDLYSKQNEHNSGDVMISIESYSASTANSPVTGGEPESDSYLNLECSKMLQQNISKY